MMNRISKNIYICDNISIFFDPQKIQEQQDMIVGLRKKLSDAEDDHHHHPDEPPPASYSVKSVLMSV